MQGKHVGQSALALVASYDLNPHVLTQLLIANGVTSPDKVQKAFQTTY